MRATRRLLFLPGAGADPSFWRPVSDRLPKDWENVHFAWPGLGDQPPSPNVNSVGDLVALIESHLGDAPADLLAQSMGGLIAMLVTLRQPTKIRRLVLAVTSAGIDTTRLGALTWHEMYYRSYPHAARWVQQVHPDLSAELPRVSHPVLLLWGDNDPISPIAVGMHLLKLLPNARLHVVRGGDHDLVQTHAGELAPLIEQHLM